VAVTVVVVVTLVKYTYQDKVVRLSLKLHPPAILIHITFQDKGARQYLKLHPPAILIHITFQDKGARQYLSLRRSRKQAGLEIGRQLVQKRDVKTLVQMEEAGIH
jgi:hypothetical protein